MCRCMRVHHCASGQITFPLFHLFFRFCFLPACLSFFVCNLLIHDTFVNYRTSLTKYGRRYQLLPQLTNLSFTHTHKHVCMEHCAHAYMPTMLVLFEDNVQLFKANSKSMCQKQMEISQLLYSCTIGSVRSEVAFWGRGGYRSTAPEPRDRRFICHRQLLIQI